MSGSPGLLSYDEWWWYTTTWYINLKESPKLKFCNLPRLLLVNNSKLWAVVQQHGLYFMALYCRIKIQDEPDHGIQQVPIEPGRMCFKYPDKFRLFYPSSKWLPWVAPFPYHPVPAAKYLCLDSKLLWLLGNGSLADCYKIDPVSAFKFWILVPSFGVTWKVLQMPQWLIHFLPQNKIHLSIKEKVVLLFLLSCLPLSCRLILRTQLNWSQFCPQDSRILTIPPRSWKLVHPVLEYLWAAHHKSVTPTLFSMDHSQDGQDWASWMHLASILPAQICLTPQPFPIPPLLHLKAGSQPVLDAIASDIQIIRDATEHPQLHEVSNKDSKMDSANGWISFQRSFRIRSNDYSLFQMMSYFWVLVTHISGSWSNQRLRCHYGFEHWTFHQRLTSWDSHTYGKCHKN